ncbi:MAG: sulfide/dihydroorotate dehydrogenase-like FAD/NAD-binding protein [Fastidiosipilaceae bacterium]|jgi:ferredoxin--NADP+ reductase
MYKILSKKYLNDLVVQMDIEAPMVANKAKAGQFIMFRVDEQGERIPLTVAGTDLEKGTVTIIFQIVGAGTRTLASKNEGESIVDFAGPLGKASDLEGYKYACVIGGGVGNAIAYPSAKALHENGTKVDVIAGFRSKDIVVLEEEFKECSDNLYITTDDGSYGRQGFVTDQLKDLLEAGTKYDLVIVIGPVIVMKLVANLTRQYGIKTLVSLNPIMVDGTGMCGCCRVTVGGETKFACVDGPEFDGHEVDFDELMKRNTVYAEQEREADHKCRSGLHG